MVAEGAEEAAAAGSEYRVQRRRRSLRCAGLPRTRASAEGVIKVLGLEADPSLAAAARASAMRGAVRRAQVDASTRQGSEAEGRASPGF